MFTKIQKKLKRKKLESCENLRAEKNLLCDKTSVCPIDTITHFIPDGKTPKKLPKTTHEEMILSKSKNEFQEINTCLEYGHIIWGKMSGYRPWPGLTIEGKLAAKTESPGWTWIFWFGDHKISNINNSKISRFDQNFFFNSKKYYSNKKFQNALDEALQVCAVRCGLNPKENDALDLYSWAKQQFQQIENLDKDLLKPKKTEEYPGFVLEKLEKFQSQVNNNFEPKTQTKDELTLQPTKNPSNKVKSKALKIQEICLCCDSSEKEIVAQHPLFEGGLCKECKEYVLETVFAVDPDNYHAFCAICSYGGEMCVCCLVQCGRVYCKKCVQRCLSDSAWEKILAQDPWVCFLCNTKVSVVTHGCLKPKPNWNFNIIQLFHCDQILQEPDLSYLKNSPNPQPLRVLSLFDGIGTGKIALDELGIAIDVYFASEIDLDALIVTRVNHGSTITEIGDVIQLTESKLSELCPIDLVIGGSPCNELSLVNPARKGFSETGTGILFFEFCRVLNIIQKLCKDRHVFWLFENVTAMKSEYKAIISRFLACQPALWDAKYFSPQQRARYFWGNIPTIYSTPPISADENLTELNYVLSPHCHRKAMVKQLRTVTTRTNSLRQGKSENILPVEMDGQEDNIWITELEVIFGFPPHYTDVRNLNYCRRQRLLGKAWSVPVIKFLLSPLSEIFDSK